MSREIPGPSGIVLGEDVLEGRESLARILASARVTSLFQPIVELGSLDIFGYEALSRGPSDGPLHNPLTLFETAREAGRITELDLLCRRCAIRSFIKQSLGGQLFLNATPQSLLEQHHRAGLTLEALYEMGVDPARVVIELTEQYPTTDFTLMARALAHYRSMGFRIAIDDLGAGYSSLRSWSELHPEFVKIDRHFVQGIHHDRAKRTFVSSIVQLAASLHCQVVAEGIETEEEYRTLLDIGILYGQGYYFGRPAEVPARTITISSSDRRGERRRAASNGSATLIHDLLVPAPAVTPDRQLEDVYQLFMDEEGTGAVAVVNKDQQPIGLLRRTRLLTTFSSQYGRSLHGHKSVLTLTDASAVQVDINWDIEHISALVARNMRSQIEADFLIVDRGRYCGLGKVIDLLRKVTETQIRNARHANPLTGLPGNVPIYERLDEAIRDREDIAVAYFDLDNFKPYNDVYGYAKGDAVIRLVASTLQDCLQHKDDFIGHVGGDDFIVVFSSADFRLRCDMVLQRFAERIREHYRADDLERGGIYALSREGEQRFFPIVSLSIGIIRPDIANMVSHDDIADMATWAKHQAKHIAGNSLYEERQRQPCRVAFTADGTYASPLLQP